MTGLTMPAAGSATLAVKGGGASSPLLAASSGVPGLAAFVDLLAIGDGAPAAIPSGTPGAAKRQGDAGSGKGLPSAGEESDDGKADPALSWLLAAVTAPMPQSVPAEPVTAVAGGAISDGLAATASPDRAAIPVTVDAKGALVPTGPEAPDPAVQPDQATKPGQPGATIRPVPLPEVPAEAFDLPLTTDALERSSPAASLPDTIQGPPKPAATIVNDAKAAPNRDLPETSRLPETANIAARMIRPVPNYAPLARPLANVASEADVTTSAQPVPVGNSASQPPVEIATRPPAPAVDTAPKVDTAAPAPAIAADQPLSPARSGQASPPATESAPAPVRQQPVATAPATAPVSAARAAAAAPALFALAMAPRPARDAKDGPSSAPDSLAASLLHTATTTPAVMRPGEPQREALDMERRDWPQKMIDRIDVLRDAANANDTSIRLKPDALGRIDVAIRHHDDGAISVRFTADHDTTRTMIADAAPQLSAAAEARGIRLSGTSVDLSGSGQGGEQARRQFDLRPNTSNRLAAREEENEAVADGRIA